MSAPQPLTGDELATIKARAEAAGRSGWARHVQQVTAEDVPRLVAEVERLRAARDECERQFQEQVAEVARLRAQVGESGGMSIPPPVITPGRTPWDICTCLVCGPPYRAEVPDWRSGPFGPYSWMALCPTCGSKRCPGANRHDRHPVEP